ncbi:MAG: cytochrome c [Bacteroidetes bacterium]|nr:MAG: cytochrome c [Bacteroidota bacterium]
MIRIYLIAVALLFSVISMHAQQAEDYFKQNCVSCHTIGGGRLTGPDLKNVAQRKDRAWLTKFLMDPKGMIESGDPYALELQKSSRGAIMPTIVGMNKASAEALLDLIEAESKLEKSKFMGMQLSDRPLTAADIALGQSIFTGETRLKNGGPQCNSCHGVRGLGGFGGGSLAPDLTTVFERYEGRKTLSVWLSAPATPTMQSVFKQQQLEPDEVLALTAFFQHTLQRSPEDGATARLNFVLIGLGGALLMLGVFDVVWGKRFRGVRGNLVKKKRSELLHE